jgi:hypothetical protein
MCLVRCVAYVFRPLKGFPVISDEFLAKEFALRVFWGRNCKGFQPSGFGFPFQLSIAWLQFCP